MENQTCVKPETGRPLFPHERLVTFENDYATDGNNQSNPNQRSNQRRPGGMGFPDYIRGSSRSRGHSLLLVD